MAMRCRHWALALQPCFTPSPGTGRWDGVRRDEEKPECVDTFWCVAAGPFRDKQLFLLLHSWPSHEA